MPAKSATGAHASRQRALRAPAVSALMIQCAALPLTFLTVYLVREWGMNMPIMLAALLQGGIAAALTYRRRLAPWWPPIQFVFPLAVVAIQMLRLPPWFFLAAFLVSLGIFWSTYRTQVPFYPSGPSARTAVAARLPHGKPIRFIDVGSGLGGMSLHLARIRPDGIFEGIELAPVPWLVSALRARLGRNPARFMRGDYGNLDFSRYDVVFAYLSPAAMPGLWDKARAEMRGGSILLSYEFSMSGVPADWVDAPDENGARLYGWKM